MCSSKKLNKITTDAALTAEGRADWKKAWCKIQLRWEKKISSNSGYCWVFWVSSALVFFNQSVNQYIFIYRALFIQHKFLYKGPKNGQWKTSNYNTCNTNTFNNKQNIVFSLKEGMLGWRSDDNYRALKVSITFLTNIDSDIQARVISLRSQRNKKFYKQKSSNLQFTQETGIKIH